MQKRKIPFKKPNSNFLDYLKSYNIFLRKNYIRGKYNRLFSEKFAKQNGCNYGITTNSGTIALFLALKVLNLPKNSEIITVSNTFIATITAIESNNLIPVFADIGQDLNILPESIEKLITKKTKAILAVHLNGIVYNYKKLRKIANKYDLIIIGDACQAHYSSYGNKKIGELADITCFSFYPSKTIDVGGEGGMIITNNKKYYQKLLDFQNYPNTDEVGLNFFMSEFHAKIGYLQTFKKDRIIKSILSNKKYFLEKLRNIRQIKFVEDIEKKGNILCYFPLLVEKRDELFRFLQTNGVDCRINYKELIHKKRKDYKGVFKNTEKIYKNLIHLPFYSSMKKSDINYIVGLVKKFYERY